MIFYAENLIFENAEATRNIDMQKISGACDPKAVFFFEISVGSREDIFKIPKAQYLLFL